MAYVNAQSPNRRLAIFAAVAVLHVLAVYALVTDLAAKWIERIPTKPPATFDVPLPKPSEKPAPQRPTVRITKPEPQRPNPFDPSPLPPQPFANGNTMASDGAGAGDLGSAVFPIPNPLPSPTFTPRGARPHGNVAQWVTASDYPTNDLRQEHQGVTRVRLTVDTAGRVARCEVIGSSGWPGLDGATCTKLVSRARFEPASDETGARVEGSFVTAVRWRLPED